METFNNLHEHFYLELVLAQAKTGKKIDPNIEHYIVHLLADLHLSNRSLFDHFKEAISGDNRLLAAKALGDEALVISSLFPDFATKNGVSIEYYTAMGKNGYSMAAGIFRKEYNDSHFADVYQEMSKEFVVLQHVLKNAVNLFNIE
jgi:hypothetical protein